MTKYTQSLFAFILIVAVIFIFFTIYRNIKNNEDKTKVIKKRKSSKDLHTKRIGGSLSDTFNKKANVDKKFKIETLCLQAGYELSFGEFKCISLGCAIAIPVVILIAIHNIFLAVIMIGLGYLLPAQYMRTLANKRVKKMEEQCGSFIQLTLERYKTSKDMAASIINTLPDFYGYQPFYDILKLCVIDIQLGMPCDEALEKLARRSGNRYLARFSDYYKISDNLATHQSKYELLQQAYLQYQENKELKALLKKEIQGPVSESYIMVAATPGFMLWQAISNKEYVDFMINTTTGQVGVAVIFVVILLCIVFINAKIAAPIE